MVRFRTEKQKQTQKRKNILHLKSRSAREIELIHKTNTHHKVGNKNKSLFCQSRNDQFLWSFIRTLNLLAAVFFFSRCILIAFSYGSLLRTLYTCFFFFLLPFLYFKSFWICNQNRWQINSNRCEFLWLLPFCVGYACLPIQIDSYSWLIIFRRAIWKKTPHTHTNRSTTHFFEFQL